jgi:hypothetical protein
MPLSMTLPSRTFVRVAAVVWAALALLAVLQIWNRPVDRDEGFWLYSAWRVTAGELPYRDFALPHLPLGVLHYAAVVKAFGPTLYGGRALNAIWFLLGGAALGVATGKRAGGRAGFLTAILYGSSSLALTWLIPIKALGPATGYLAWATAAFLWPVPIRRLPIQALIAGLCLGAAVMCRLTLLSLLAAAALAAWTAVPTGSRRGMRIANVAALCAGFATGLSLAAYFRIKTGDAFAFNVWGIHSLFLDPSGTARWLALREFLLPPDPTLLIVLAAASLAKNVRSRALVFPWAATAVTLVANITPGTTSLQYFAPAVATAAPAAAVTLAVLFEKRRALALILTALMVLLGTARPAAKVLLDRAHKKMVGPAEVCAAAAFLKEETSPGDIIFTAWPGYAALAERRVAPGWELGYFTDRIGKRVSAADRRRYHLITYDETKKDLEAGKYRLFFDGLDTPAEFQPVLQSHFRLLEERQGVKLWLYVGSNPDANIKY